MPVSSRFAISVHTLAVLAFLEKQGVKRVSSLIIARSVNTHPVVIRNLLRSLKSAGIVDSKEGKAGGITLARSAAKISLDEIFAAVEEPGILGTNPHPVFKDCPVSSAMKGLMTTLFKDVDLAVYRTLKGRTLKQIVDQISI